MIRSQRWSVSEVQSTEALAMTLHQAIIRGNLSKGSQALLKAELSEMHQYSLGAVCLQSIPRSRLQESAPQTGNNLPLKSAAITSRERAKINSTHLATRRQAESAGPSERNTVWIKTHMERTVIREVDRWIDYTRKVNIAKKSSHLIQDIKNVSSKMQNTAQLSSHCK